MKKLEYKINSEIKDAIDVNINNFLEPHSKKNNCWWSNLEMLSDGITNIKDYYNHKILQIKRGQIPTEEFIPDESLTTAKTCPAIGSGILDKVYLIKAPTDILISIDNEGNFFWKSADSLLQIQNHPNIQFHTKSNNPFEGYINIKFCFPIIMRTDNIPWMFLQPQYHKQDYPFTVINGIVEGKHTKKQDLNVNTIIKIPTTEEVVTHVIKAGTVLAYMWFPERLQLKEVKEIKKPLKKRFIGGW